MNPQEESSLHHEMKLSFAAQADKIDSVLEVSKENREELKKINGRLRGVELWKARMEGAFLSWRAVPIVSAAVAAAAAVVAVAR